MNDGYHSNPFALHSVHNPIVSNDQLSEGAICEFGHNAP